MYTLRIIEEKREGPFAPFQQVTENFALGNAYSLIENGKTKEFEEFFTDCGESKEGVRAVLCSESGPVFFIMEDTSFEKRAYYIMTESGKTFEKI